MRGYLNTAEYIFMFANDEALCQVTTLRLHTNKKKKRHNIAKMIPSLVYKKN